MSNEVKEKSIIETVQDFMHEHKDLLFIAANPKTDLIMIAYRDKYTAVQFPFESMDKGVVFNALRKSKFDQAITPLMEGITKATGISSEDSDGLQIHHVIGGSIKGIGEALNEDRSKALQVIPKNKNAKSKKGCGGKRK